MSRPGDHYWKKDQNPVSCVEIEHQVNYRENANYTVCVSKIMLSAFTHRVQLLHPWQGGSIFGSVSLYVYQLPTLLNK